MATDRASLASVAYWRGERQPQRFYIAFCLLMSSIQDALLGLKEEESANLNWSATCSYYALVHAGRLLTFIGLGDYPTSHADLRRLVGRTTRQQRPRAQRGDGFPFDWLRGFRAETIPGTPQGNSNRWADNPGEYLELRNSIIEYLTGIGVERAPERLEQFGTILGATADLRNDSNYEALLIAHEYEHVKMSSAFKDLAREMAAAADSNLPFVEDAFRCFLCADPDLETDRPRYCAMAQDYLATRLSIVVYRRSRSRCSDVGRRARSAQSAESAFRRPSTPISGGASCRPRVRAAPRAALPNVQGNG